MCGMVDKNICVECGSNHMINQHHVVPQSKGGTFTIPLCLDCHSKIHGKKVMKMQTLAKQGYEKMIKEANRKGIKPNVGRKKGSGESNTEFLKKHHDVVNLLFNEKLSMRKVRSITGKSTNTVLKVKKIYKQEMLSNKEPFRIFLGYDKIWLYEEVDTEILKAGV